MANPREYAQSASTAYAEKMDMYQNTQQGYAVPAPPLTASSEVFSTLDAARELSYRVKEAVNRLCGNTPEPVGSKLRGESQGAVFPSLRDSALEARDVIQSAHEALSRLEREIP